MADAPIVEAPVVAQSAPVVAPAAPVVEVAPAAPAAPLVAEVPSLLETLAPEAPKAEAPVVAEAPKVDAAPEAPKADAAPEAPKAEEAKAPEAPKVEAAPEAPKAEEVKAPEAPVVEKIEWKLELPPEIKASDEQLTGLRGLLDAIVAPSEALTREQAAQGLLAMHHDAIKSYADQTLVNQHREFNKTRETWRTAVMADPEIGGAGYETASRAIARMRDLFVSSAKPGSDAYNDHMREFNEMLRVTGAGDHPAMLRFVHNVAGRFDEPSLPAPNPKPPKTNGPQPNGKTVLYDNPRSQTGSRQ